METVTVNLGSRSYPIMIGAGLCANIGEFLCAHGFRPGPVAVVTDANVGPLYAKTIVESLRHADFRAVVIEIPAGEEHKNLAQLSSIYDELIDGGLERRSPLIALGGGVVGDLTGFAAATFQRGVPFIQIPTTLLAQVDASVGGKTAIDHRAGKNLIGAFYQPRLVVIDVDTLRTLPERELRAGMAEVIKYGVILSPDLFAVLEHDMARLLHLEPALLTAVIKTCCQLKAQVVEADETESDYRAILNFGHTLGHAIENATGYTHYLHGEAVAIGMIFAAHVSHQRGLCHQTVRERLCRLLKSSGLPVALPAELKGEQLIAGMMTDKKMAEGKVKFVCIERLGKTRFEHLSVREIGAYL